MEYSELITFQPIESVIQLRDANRQASARKLVASYVISNEMSQRLSEVVIPHLQYEKPHDNKGILIVGNYGTGKSHLLSVLSSVAENADLLPLLTNPIVQQAASNIAGKFQVIRLEIGSTQMALREIITTALEKSLADWDVSFRFPDATQQYENKTSFENMMGVFQKKFPNQGLLIVVDELLDYLRSRHDQPLILDLGFLRELGEVCMDLRFRFVAGVQEAIFDSGRFAHVASSLGRVKDRFQQVRIASTDVKYVVANRLLKKSPKQLGQIREYLQPFVKFYANMNERMDDFAELFPIHPGYIETFEQIPIVEKRGVLQIISDTIKKLVDQAVPSDHPGVKAFDSYWETLIENPANKAIPEVAEIIKCSDVLAAKIKNAYTRPQYRPMALRIVDALSVHRLTTHDPYSPIGLTPEELRDGLCLYHQAVASLPGDPAANLLTVVETALREIHRTVSGQFISFNKDNRQYFLDLKKLDDYDALIEKRSDALDKNVLDRYYYDALRQVLECTDASTFTGWQIWEHEIVWKERQAPRLGYLFFGTPSERSTAIPPRDFYFYFVQPFDPPRFTDDKLPDEVFFRLSEKDQAFDDSLKFYAAALELAGTSSGVKKEMYQKKASTHLDDLTKWMRDHLLAAMDVTYQGQKKKLSRWLQGRSGGGPMNIRDTINTVGSTCLAEHFANRAPNYPTFSIILTTRSIPQAAQDALRGIAQPLVKAIYAGFWNRFAASFIDSVIVVIGGFLPSLPFLIAEGMSTATTYPFWMILEFIVSLVIGWLYFTLLESSTKQATIGKMAVGIIVTDLNGKRIFFGRANGRYWGKVISFLILGIGYIMAGFTRKKQALHDIMADTLVLARPEGVRSWVTTTIIGGSIVILLVGISILVLNLQDVRDARDTQTAKPASAIKLFKPDRGNFGIWYDESKWLKTKQPDKEGKILFHLIGEDGYGMVISEGIGMPTTTLKEQALENALEAAPDAKIIFEENGVR